MNEDNIYQIGELIGMVLTELREINSKLDSQDELKIIKSRLEAMEKKDEVLSISEASAFTGKSKPTIRTYIRQGKLTKVSRGCKEGVLRSELETFKRI